MAIQEAIGGILNNIYTAINTAVQQLGALVEAVSNSGTIAATGTVTSSGATAGLGYTTGAGGLVTQNTSKSTGVTIDKVTGQITMNNATLNAGAEVSFTVTNAAIAAADIVIVNHASGGTAGAYGVYANAILAGSFAITVTNLTGGNLGEAIVLHFAIIRGATA